MFTRIRDWCNDRTGYRDLLAPVRNRTLPDGPRWEYVTASCLLWMLVVEIISGLLLMTTYSPSTTTAWASIFYIEKMSGGSFIRGLHYYASQALIVLFALHTIRVLLAAAFRKPYELVWVSGLLLAPLLILWAVTGNPLSYSQKAVGQIEVEANILGNMPVFGESMKTVLLGGDSVGHLTVTHFYFLHVALLPMLVALLALVHISQVWRHGPTAMRTVTSTEREVPYYPHQTIRNIFAFSVVFAIVAYFGYTYGAPLEEPADAGLPSSPRPEWYFLFLYELKNHYLNEFVATTLVPAGLLLLMLLIPVIDHFVSHKLSVGLRYFVVIVGVIGWSILTLGSMQRDRNDRLHQDTLLKSHNNTVRAKELANKFDFTSEGAIGLLRHDPLTQGPLLFSAHCVNCHSHTYDWGVGLVSKQPSAPNLFRVGSREWIAGLLDPERITSEDYFGNTAHAEGDMVEFVTDSCAGLEDEDREQLDKIIIALSAEAQIKSQIDADAEALADGTIEEGREAIIEFGCTDCHKFHDEGEGLDLTGYASRQWLIDFISNPEHERFYPESNDRMPAYAPYADDSKRNRLSKEELELLVDWLRNDWYDASVDPDLKKPAE